jgi:hypothetical protein
MQNGEEMSPYGGLDATGVRHEGNCPWIMRTSDSRESALGSGGV